MTANAITLGDHAPTRGEPGFAVGWATWSFVCLVVAAGVIVLARATAALRESPIDAYVVLLAVLTVASGRFKIKLPGRPVTVSVSEVFVFVAVLLFGPAPAAVIVAFDGLWISLTQRHRRIHRALFNVAEPAVSTWIAGSVFFAVAGVPPPGLSHSLQTALVLPTVAMAATYFLLNTSLTAIAVALENGGSAYELWRQHALYLGINYYAAASVATLVVNSPLGINFQMIGLVAPLLMLSYAAYYAAASRMEDAQRHIREVEHLYHATVETLAIAVDAKDQITHGHVRRVQRHAIALAQALGVNDEIELKALKAAALLHDVGKLAVPDYVLSKPGTLSDAEFEQIKVHAAKGAEILTAVEFPYPVVPIVRHHHEHWNGQGYPDGLAGTDIPVGARILTVVDCFDALTSDRPYRRKMTDEEAIGILKAESSKMYDPSVVETFAQLVPSLRRDDHLAEAYAAPHDPVVTGHGSSSDNGRSHSTGSQTMARPSLLGLIGPTVTEKLAQSIPDAETCIFTLEPGSGTLTPAHSSRLVRDALAHVSLRLGQGLSGWVAANRHTIVNSDPGLDLGDAARQLGLRACTSTPVFALGELVGVVSVYLPQPRGFSDNDVRVIAGLAQELGLEMARCQQGLAFDPWDAHVSARGHAAVC